MEWAICLFSNCRRLTGGESMKHSPAYATLSKREDKMMTSNNTTGLPAQMPLVTVWATILLMLALLSPAHAADFEAGMQALERGDFAAALREFRPLAEQGDARGQFMLGLMYAEGRGVPQDDVEAYAWLNIAAANANGSLQAEARDNAVKVRAHVAQRMTREARSRAQQLAREYWEAYVQPFQD